MRDIKITNNELKDYKTNYNDYGAESFIIKKSDNTLYKIFKTLEEPVLENKLKKVIEINKKNIEFLTNPTSTISCNGKFVGYELLYDSSDLPWWNKNLSREEEIVLLKNLKEKLLILEDNGIIYGDIKDDNLLITHKNKLKICDVDNIQLNGLKMDKLQTALYSIVDNNGMFDENAHSLMHNLFTLIRLEKITPFYYYAITEIKNYQKFTSFNSEAFPILDEVIKVDKVKKISNRYLIDYLK